MRPAGAGRPLRRAWRDLQKRRIRCVGNPLDRFGEDAPAHHALLCGFSAQLPFSLLRKKTWEAVKVLGPPTLSRISAERNLRGETSENCFLSDHPEELKKPAWEAGITRGCAAGI